MKDFVVAISLSVNALFGLNLLCDCVNSYHQRQQAQDSGLSELRRQVEMDVERLKTDVRALGREVDTLDADMEKIEGQKAT